MSALPRLVVVSGPPGAGKTTVAAVLRDRFVNDGGCDDATVLAEIVSDVESKIAFIEIGAITARLGCVVSVFPGFAFTRTISGA